LALFPRAGEPRLLASVTPRDIPAMRLMTWITDVHSGWNWQSAFDPWLAGFAGDGPIDVGSVGFDLMRPPLFQSLETSLGNRFRLHPADAAVAACRSARPRELSQIRAASAVARATADAFIAAWRSGMGVEAAALEAERTARMLAAQDVRTLVSFDGGRTLAPFRGTFDAKSSPLAGYVAVKHMGYWADMFVSAADGPGLVAQRVAAALDAALRAAKPGVAAAALFAQASEALAPHALHSVLSGNIGHRIGLSQNEGGEITREASHVLATGDVYTLRVGAHDPAQGGAFASALIAVDAKGCEILLRSPAPQS
jgi:Xaa-Pro aminopeptidase